MYCILLFNKHEWNVGHTQPIKMIDCVNNNKCEMSMSKYGHTNLRLPSEHLEKIYNFAFDYV